jgi:ABC-2 type transport system ATP-binding protein
MSTAPAIRARGVRKAFGSRVVLDGVDLTVAEGSVFGLLGPNGAGKTTLVNILATLLDPDQGEVVIAGHDLTRDPDGVRSAIGVTGQFSAVDSLLTGAENLWLMADLRHLDRREGTRRVGELLEQFELADAAGQRVATYSGGMKRRLDLAMTLVGRPRIIFLDEPTTGLDPRSRRTMWTIVRDLVADGVTILLTTQYLDEADHLADLVGILDQGHIVAEGVPAQLKQRVPGGHVDVRFCDAQSMAAAARLLDTTATDGETLTLQIPGDSSVASLRNLLNRLDEAGLAAERLTVHEADLDDVFLALTGHATTQREPVR